MAGEFLDFALALVIIVFIAKISGYISTRLRQPSVLGELLAGIILGPTLLDFFHWPIFHHGDHLVEPITLLAEFGVVLLMMLAGMELHLPELLQSGKVAALAGTLGVLVPVGLGIGTAVLFAVDMNQAIFVGLALAATSVSISAQTLIELNVLRSRVGLAMLGAAVFDDILVILLLSIGFLLIGSGAAVGLGSIAITILKMVLYLAAASFIGARVLPFLAYRVSHLPISQGTTAFALVVCLLFAWAAEALGGMAAITGAFLAGLFLARTPLKHDIEESMSALAYGFVVPIFLVNIGLAADFGGISGTAWVFAIVLTIVAVVSKILGSGLGALWGGFNRRESVQLGIGMVSRGEVGLIVASFALLEGLMTADVFSIVVFMVIIATVVTPPLLRLAFSGETEGEKDPTPGVTHALSNETMTNNGRLSHTVEEVEKA